MIKGQRTKDKGQIIWFFFALLIIFVYFFGLTIPLVGPDEPRYAQIAREMLGRGDWITPKLGGFDWFEKPALLYWLQIISYKLFGINEFAARFGSAIFGLLTVFCLWILGIVQSAKQCKVQSAKCKAQNYLESGIWNLESGIWNLEFANWLVLIAASSIGLIAFSRGASFDIILTFPITASLVGFFIFDRSNKNSPFTFHFSLFTFHFFIGIALLAKGLVGIVFPLAIVAFYYVLSWKLPNRTFIFSLIWGTILSLLVAAVWYLPMYQINGWKFIDEFFIQHHFRRFTSDVYQHHQPFWFFFAVLPLMTLPWLPFFFASIWDYLGFWVQGSRFKVQDSETLGTEHLALGTFAFSWLLVPLVFFSFSGSKLPGYILPALPGALVLTAISVVKFIGESAKRKCGLQILAFLTLGVVILILQFAAPDYAVRDSVKSLVTAANAQGFAAEKIVNLYTVSHNLEFYAPDRLIRNDDGTQKRYDDYSVLVSDVKNTPDGKILVLVPHKDLVKLLTENSSVETKVLGDNGELAIILLNGR